MIKLLLVIVWSLKGKIIIIIIMIMIIIIIIIMIIIIIIIIIMMIIIIIITYNKQEFNFLQSPGIHGPRSSLDENFK